jgi:cytochrome c oxidase subunit 2
MKLLSIVLLMLGANSALSAEKTELCVLCHGTNTNGNLSVRAPKLAGLDREYVQRQLAAFRSGVRGTHALDVSGSEMRIIALSLSEAEITQALDFLAKQKGERPPYSVQGNVQRGAALYANCASCHGKRGEGNLQIKAPALAQGSDWYWLIQLNNYRNGLRGTNPTDELGGAMRAAAQTLSSEQAVLDVVAYINTLR